MTDKKKAMPSWKDDTAHSKSLRLLPILYHRKEE